MTQLILMEYVSGDSAAPQLGLKAEGYVFSQCPHSSFSGWWIQFQTWIS